MQVVLYSRKKWFIESIIKRFLVIIDLESSKIISHESTHKHGVRTTDAFSLVLVSLWLVVLYYYYLEVAQIVILFYLRPLSTSILVKNGTFLGFQLMCDGWTDGWTDQWTHGPTDGHTLL